MKTLNVHISLYVIKNVGVLSIQTNKKLTKVLLLLSSSWKSCKLCVKTGVIFFIASTELEIDFLAFLSLNRYIYTKK